MLNSEQWRNSRPQEKLKQRSLLLTGPGERTSKPSETTWGDQGRVQTESEPGAHTFIRDWG